MREYNRDEIQDRLPEFASGQLAGDDAEVVERAVALDPELAAELAILRRVQAAHRHAPGIDITRIVAALPSPNARPPQVVDELAARRAAKAPMISRRFARAAALLVVVGGGTLVSVWGRGVAPGTGTTPSVTQAESLGTGPAAMSLGLGASTDDLSVEQLRALEADIQSLDGMPSAEPDAGTELLPGEGA